MIFIRYAYGIAAVPSFLVGSGCLCPLFRAGMIDGVGFAVRLAAMGANGFFGAGGSAAGVLRVAVLSRVIRHIAVFIGTFMPVMCCIGRPLDFQLWPVAGIGSIFVAPHLVQLYVFSPAFVQVGAVVIVPLSQV